MSTEAPEALRADACPEPEQLAAYVDGRLPPDERTLVERHLAECGECRDVVAGSVEANAALGAVPVARPARPRRSTWRWAGLGAVLAAAAAIVVVVRLQQASPYYVPEMAQLVGAVGSSRPVEPRLTGNFAYGPYSVTRGAGKTTAPLSVIAAAARIEERAKRGDAPAEAALGVAQLALGDPRAVDTLEDAARRDRDPRIKNDLAAAYLVTGLRNEDARLLARALENAEQAVASMPGAPEPLFNRALALEALGLPAQAAKAWDAYLAVDSTSSWADEARQRRARLSAQTKSSLDRVRDELERAAASDADNAALSGLVRRQAFQAREFVEGELLERWSRAVLRGAVDEAQAAAAAARRVGAALIAASGDRFASDVWRHAITAPDRRRLAEGMLDYAAGRHELDEFNTAAADRLLAKAEAALAGAGSPLALAARFHRTLPAYYRREYAAATAALDAIESNQRDRNYLSLTGQIRWRRGLISLVRGDYAASLSAYRESLRIFEQTQEADHIASVENALAENLRYLGDMDESWAYQLRALRTISGTWNPRRRHAVLLTAARSSLRDRLPRSALAIQDELVANALAWGEPAALTSAHLQRARSLAALDRPADAETELSRAREALRQVGDGVFSGQYETELAMATGEVAARSKPRDAIRALATADGQLQSSGAILRRPQLLLAAGRAAKLAGNPVEAAAAFENGIQIFEHRRTVLPDEERRISMFDDAWDLFDEMVRLDVERDRPQEALAYLERARGRTLLHGLEGHPAAEPLSPDAIRRRLPPRVALIYYALLDDRLYTWLVSERTTLFHQSAVDRAAVETLVRQSREEILSGSRERRASVRLHDLLLAPLRRDVGDGSLIAIVPDGVLNAVSFAALVDADGVPLVARNPVMKTVSGTAFVTGRDARASDNGALIVGNPKIDTAAFPGLDPLPAAEAEATDVARLYPGATVLLNAGATKAAFRAALGHAGTIHFAGHALANTEYPWLSRLVLAPSPEGSTLFAYEVAQLPLERVNLVVLGACSSAAGAMSRSEGPLSVARPFIAAGVPAVVAALWDVADAPSGVLLRDFHRRVAAGDDPVTALQRAQRAMAGSRDPSLAAAAAWAGFEAIGSLPRQYVSATSRQEADR